MQRAGMKMQRKFLRDMNVAGIKVRMYNGRFFYHGYAAETSRDDRIDMQDVMSATKVKLQTDNMGLDYVLYPRIGVPDVDTGELKEKMPFADTVSMRDGVITIRRGFFYRMGGSSEKFAARVKEVFPNAEIIDHGEHWAAFRGGASVRNSSHWWVKFTLGTRSLSEETQEPGD